VGGRKKEALTKDGKSLLTFTPTPYVPIVVTPSLTWGTSLMNAP